jgi:hypothetical protein
MAGSDTDLDNLFGVAADRPVFQFNVSATAIVSGNFENMLTAFLYLSKIRDEISPLLPA